MDIKQVLIYIENHGIGIVFMCFCGFGFWKYLMPTFTKMTDTLEEMRIFLETQNKGYATGKTLNILCDLKAEFLKNQLEKMYFNYIENNNFKNNWNTIISEIDVKILNNLLEFEDDLKDVVEKINFKSIKKTFTDHTRTIKEEIEMLLKDLKENGEKETELYALAKRSVRIHLDNFQTELKKELKELLN